MNVLIDKSNNELVGQCGLLVHEVDGVEELEIGYSIIPTQQGKGYATEAAGKCRDFAFEHNLSESLICLIDPENIVSKNVANKNGMALDRMVIFNGYCLEMFRVWRANLKRFS
jgi:RimJ/RimL family protein N-acetyltransferase